MPATVIKKVEAVLFDLDGTLLDTAPDFIAVIKQMCIDYNKATPDDKTIRNTVSDGARALVTLIFNITEGDEFVALTEELKDRYSKSMTQHTIAFPGIEALIKQIESKKIPWGVVTNKPSMYADPILKGLNMNVQTLVCPDHVTHSKPHAEPMLKACAELNVSPENCFYVGDHIRDIEAGKNAKMKTIAALYGYIKQNDTPEDWQADFNVNHANEIAAIIFNDDLK